MISILWLLQAESSGWLFKSLNESLIISVGPCYLEFSAPKEFDCQLSGNIFTKLEVSTTSNSRLLDSNGMDRQTDRQFHSIMWPCREGCITCQEHVVTKMKIIAWCRASGADRWKAPTILEQGLRACGPLLVSCKQMTWKINYLSEHKHSVPSVYHGRSVANGQQDISMHWKFGTHSSAVASCSEGVLQGSVLGLEDTFVHKFQSQHS